jgi:hypothetical protein
VVVGVEVWRQRLVVTLPEGAQGATLLVSEALLARLGGGGGGGGGARHAQTLPAALRLRSSASQAAGEAAETASEVPLRWALAGDASLPAGYAPPLLEAPGGRAAPGRAAAVPLRGGAPGSSRTFTLELPPAALAGQQQQAGLTNLSPFPPPSYGAAFLGADWRTRGSWQGTYGADGGVLFGLGVNGSDLAFLPPYIASVRGTFSFTRGTWASALNVSDERALQLPGCSGSCSGGRSLGYLSDVMGQDPTYALDVALRSASSTTQFFTIALYAADWDSRGRRGTVALLDAATLNPLSPIQGLREYEGGVWLVWNVSGSFRLRVSQTRGDNAPVSALLFG